MQIGQNFLYKPVVSLLTDYSCQYSVQIDVDTCGLACVARLVIKDQASTFDGPDLLKNKENASCVSELNAADLSGDCESATHGRGPDKFHFKIRQQDILGILTETGIVTGVDYAAVAGMCSKINSGKKDISEVVARGISPEILQVYKLETLGGLAGGIFHEINTPIQSIHNNLEFLKKSYNALIQSRSKERYTGSQANQLKQSLFPGNKMLDADFLEEEIPQGIEESLESIDQVIRIIRSIKEYSLSDSRAKTHADINRAIENAAIITRNKWKYIATLTTDFDARIQALKSEDGIWDQIFVNMILNSAEAIEKSFPQNRLGSIQISTRNFDRHIEIKISDTGCGIAPELQAKIFAPFYTTKNNGGNTGHGMSIVYDCVVNKHGGRILCDSEVGKGTVFTLKIPIVKGF